MKQLVIGLAAIGLMAGCASNAGTGASTSAPAAGTSALATLAPKSGSNVQGTIKLLQQGDNRVAMAVDIAGLPPNGMFGFHVHEKGDCSSPDGMSAGGHFNPTASRTVIRVPARTMPATSRCCSPMPMARPSARSS